MTKFLNISTDNTLGGSSASDEAVSSQKAIKDYVDGQASNYATSAQGALADTAVQPATLNNYVTLNTLQTLTSGKKIFATDAVMAGNQTALLATISNNSTYTTDNAWVGRYICGAKNLTFLMGTYRTMAGIGAHSWTNAQTGSGASWADFYLNPDGSNAVYIGGNLWTKNSGWMKIKNNGNASGTVQVNRGTISSASWKGVACWGDNISNFTNDSGYITGITSSDVTTALGYTPYDASNPSGYTSNVGTVTSVNNTSPDGNGNVSISIPSEVTETTVSNWGFTKNTGTVTSVNNTSPDGNGNVSLTIPTVNNPTITITQGGVTKGSFTLNQASGDTIALDAGGGGSLPSQTGNAGKFLTTDGTDASWGRVKTNDLFDFKWTDYELSDQNWLRADTYSWQDGTVYSEAYNHLVDDIDGKTATTETVNGTTVTYYLADDGHKIVQVVDESPLADLFTATGVCWYYVLDMVNHKFKLPRTKFGFTGYRDAVGKYVPETLPNIKGIMGGTVCLGNMEEGALYKSSGAGAGLYGNISATSGFSSVYGINASLSSSTYQDDAPVQQRSTQMYLYFYVGQFSQSATEQTAGLNAELFNGKVDLDAANLSDAGKSLIAGLGMPSDTYEDLTLGASDTEYTAPTNGFYYVCKGASTGQFIQITNLTANNKSHEISASNNQCVCFMPTRKDDIVKIKYTASGTLEAFRFIYAEGSESEAS